jgi:hypothetical protein
MIWATWRMHRTVFLVSIAVVIAFAIWLIFNGLAQQHAWALVVGHRCAQVQSGSLAARCLSYQDSYEATTHFNHFEVGACIVLPALFGLVIGTPLVATELQQSTNRLAWSQSITRARWLAAKCGVGALVVAIPMAALVPLFWWWIKAARRGSPIQPQNFDMAGFVIVAYALFAFALGVTLGALIRRPGWAFASSVPVFVLVRLAVHDFIRPRLISPVSEAVPANTQPSPTAWLQQMGYVTNGRLSPSPGQSWSSASYRIFQCQGYSGGSARPAHSINYCENFFHLHFVVQFQPESHFWPLQTAESAVFLGISAVLLGVTMLAVRRWRT